MFDPRANEDEDEDQILNLNGQAEFAGEDSYSENSYDSNDLLEGHFNEPNSFDIALLSTDGGCTRGKFKG